MKVPPREPVNGDEIVGSHSDSFGDVESIIRVVPIWAKLVESLPYRTGRNGDMLGPGALDHDSTLG